jgi:hypothetical protein
VLVIFWIRGTYPRMRIDQLMSFGWKWLIPLSFAVFIAAASQMFYGWPQWSLTIISVVILAIPVVIQLRSQRNPARELGARYVANAVVVTAKARPEPETPETPAGEGANA